jgi:hypothetical protein
MTLDRRIVEQFFRVLVDEIRDTRPEYLDAPFTVAEIYQSLVPYRTHRDRIGVELNGDYEEALMHLLGGDPAFLRIESEPARDRIRKELASKNPNTGVFREYAALSVRLSSDRVAGLGIDVKEAQEADIGSEAPAAATEPSDGAAPPISPGASLADLRVPGAAGGGAPHACPDCGSALPDRSSLRFCPSCGTNVLIVPCSVCGEELERGWSFCVACGTPTG